MNRSPESKRSLGYPRSSTGRNSSKSMRASLDEASDSIFIPCLPRCSAVEQADPEKGIARRTCIDVTRDEGLQRQNPNDPAPGSQDGDVTPLVKLGTSKRRSERVSQRLRAPRLPRNAYRRALRLHYRSTRRLKSRERFVLRASIVCYLERPLR